MRKIERYRLVYNAFKDLCASGNQTCSFSAYCIEHDVDADDMSKVLKGEYMGVSAMSGYTRMYAKRNKDTTRSCRQTYEDFKALCVQGKQPGSFYRFCAERGIRWCKMHYYLKSRKLKVGDLDGYTKPIMTGISHSQSIAFEDVIFEESGFFPVEGGMITVKVDRQIVVSFPPDTDICVIAKFVKKLGKEVEHVGA